MNIKAVFQSIFGKNAQNGGHQKGLDTFKINGSQKIIEVTQ